MACVLMTVPRLMCLGIAFLIYRFGDRNHYRERMALLASWDLGFLYLCVVVFSILVQWLNVYPTVHKKKLNLKGDLQANMQFFKVNRIAGPRLPYVVLEDEGTIGEYNRANRSLFHFTENMGGVILCIVCAGFVFHIPTFVCTLAFAIGRVAHQIDYSQGGHGEHARGYVLNLFCALTLEGLVTVVALASSASSGDLGRPGLGPRKSSASSGDLIHGGSMVTPIQFDLPAAVSAVRS
eukprot:CAMPEP_0179158608 /NCGR_PEP_ID=MMETSP0796-20121207/77397_1 /TAXON_ID=73915 /ORGANISM="Pyrodinium bahamense, Strain pbaha01" /LENGTH=236 /DNA_ID=CAMNT_0020860283 /DNA_START=27 /DNA_END=738 /DNA_ORIENTATION=+